MADRDEFGQHQSPFDLVRHCNIRVASFSFLKHHGVMEDRGAVGVTKLWRCVVLIERSTPQQLTKAG